MLENKHISKVKAKSSKPAPNNLDPAHKKS